MHATLRALLQACTVWRAQHGCTVIAALHLPSMCFHWTKSAPGSWPEKINLLLRAGVISSGQLWPAVALLSRNPQAIISVLALSLAATVGEQQKLSHTYSSCCACRLIAARKIAADNPDALHCLDAAACSWQLRKM